MLIRVVLLSFLVLVTVVILGLLILGALALAGVLDDPDERRERREWKKELKRSRKQKSGGNRA